jgi:hypothetical protein
MDAPIAEYTLLYAQTAEDLKEQVRDHLRQGWQLHGPLVSSDLDFVREMVRYAAPVPSAKEG